MSQFNALITNLTVNDDAFAVIPETGESIYIPPGVTRAAKLVAGEHRMVTVVENNPERRSNTPWMGVFVEPPATEMPKAHQAQDDSALLDKILDAFEPNEYLTTDEVVEAVDLDERQTRSLLNKLFDQRRVARADVYHGTNSKPVGYLWAADPVDFLVMLPCGR